MTADERASRREREPRVEASSRRRPLARLLASLLAWMLAVGTGGPALATSFSVAPVEANTPSATAEPRADETARARPDDGDAAGGEPPAAAGGGDDAAASDAVVVGEGAAAAAAEGGIEGDGRAAAANQPAAAPPPPRVARAAVVRVAVGLAPDAPGSREERAVVDLLERAVRASPSPRVEVRRLRAGAAEARVVCREGRDDLIITVGYLPDPARPALFSHDCLIDEPLGVRSADAAGDPDLVATLWEEHDERLRQGARERRRTRIDPRVRTALIIGSAVVVLGVAVGFLLAGALRRDTVMLRVEPQ